MLKNIEFKNLFEAAPYGIFILELETKKILLVNQAGGDHLGYSINDLQGRPFLSVFPDSYRAQVLFELSSLEKKRGTNFKSQQVHKESNLIDVEISASLIQYENKGIIQCFIKDITEQERLQKNLELSESNYRSQVETIPWPCVTWQKHGSEFIIKDVNEHAMTMTENLAENLLGCNEKKLWENDKDLVEILWKCHRDKQDIKYEKEYQFKLLDECKFLLFCFVYVKDDIVRVYVQDVTEKKQIIDKLVDAHKKVDDLRYALDQSAIVAITDKNGIITHANDKFCELSLYKREELIGKTHRIINSGHHSRIFWKKLWSTIKKGKIWRGEIKNRAKDGSFYWVDTTIVPISDENLEPFQFIAIRSDITTLEFALEELKLLVSQKDTLLKEIHHRVKNNMQVVTSLLSLQSSFITDPNLKGVFKYSQYRINSMGLVHEMLYQSKDVSKILFKDYVKRVVDQLITAMKGSENHISVNYDIPDFCLNTDTSIPLGLLINEVITNSLKYGVPDGQSGTITISAKQLKYPKFKLEIGDNGIGYSEEINFRTSDSLGLILIHKLSLQLRGTIEKDNSKKGTNYLLFFEEIEQTS